MLNYEIADDFYCSLVNTLRIFAHRLSVKILYEFPIRLITTHSKFELITALNPSKLLRIALDRIPESNYFRFSSQIYYK